MQDKKKKLFLIKNEEDESVGVYFSISLDKLVEYIETNDLFPKTDITIEEFQHMDNHHDVIPLVSSERYLWYELKHHNIIHIVK